MILADETINRPKFYKWWWMAEYVIYSTKSAPPMRSLSQAIISASRTTFFLILAEHGRELAAELSRPSASLMMPCTPSRSIVESFPLLLKIIIFGSPLAIWTWICARSPSYLVSAQILTDSGKCNKAFAHPVPFTDLGSYQARIVSLVSTVPILTMGQRSTHLNHRIYNWFEWRLHMIRQFKRYSYLIQACSDTV